MADSDRPAQRLVSLDAFRGATIAAMILVNNPGSWGHIYAQLDHAEWNGWTLTDLIFPFFLFITGISIVLSFSRRPTRPRAPVYLQILRRALSLFALGLLLNGFPSYDLSSIRVMGVLQRISICYLLTATIHLELGLAGQVLASASCLAVYWGLMSWFPVPGVGAGVWEKGHNFAAYVDQLTLGKHIWAAGKTWDPEGLVSTLPAVSTTLFGVFAGLWLKSGRSHASKARGLALAGAIGLASGAVWNRWLPINKNLWTCSYAVFMAGFASAALSAFYYVIEIRGRKKWAYPFTVYGANSIAVFVFSGFLARVLNLWKVAGPDGRTIAVKTYLYATFFASWLRPLNASLAFAVVFIAVNYVPIWVLYKKKIFLKV